MEETMFLLPMVTVKEQSAVLPNESTAKYPL